MKSQINRRKVPLLWLAVGACYNAANAQETTPGQDKADKNRHFIPVRNVPPDLLAWQIDSQHQSEPASISRTRQLWQQFNGISNASAFPHDTLPMARQKGDLLFPLQVRALSPSENPPGLSVEIDENNLPPLRALVALLDKPLQKVEIGVQVVRVPRKIADYWQRNDSKTFAFADPKNAHSSLFPTALLQTLEKILIVSQFSARTMALNNSAALAESAAKTSAATDPKNDKRWRFLTIPTINSDGTITAIVLATSFLRSPTTNLEIENPEIEDAEIIEEPTFTQSRLQTMAHLRDGETLVLSGINVNANDDAGEEIDIEQSMIEIVLITARTLAATAESEK